MVDELYGTVCFLNAGTILWSGHLWAVGGRSGGLAAA